MYRIHRLIGISFLILLGLCFLLRVEAPIPVFVRAQLIGLVLAAMFFIYVSLAWFIPVLINRSAEQLSPHQLVAITIASSGITAALTGLGMLLVLQLIWQVPLRPTDYFFTCGLFAVLTAGVTSIYSLKSFVERWKGLLLMEEGLKQAVLKAEFETLKNQINPHFLFNSLNILSALIPEDTGKSVQFVERLSKLFRYNLQHSDQNTVALLTELKVAESYLFIHHMRFGDNFRYCIQVDDADRQKQIVTQGLLTLLENVVKHNECSRENPLTVRIFSEESHLVVANTLQPKSNLTTASTGIGLKNLKSRYSQLVKSPVDVVDSGPEFIVKLPLL